MRPSTPKFCCLKQNAVSTSLAHSCILVHDFIPCKYALWMLIFFLPWMLQRQRMPHNDNYGTCMKTVQYNCFHECKKIQRESNNFFSINIWCIERHELNTWQNLKWKYHFIRLDVVDAAEISPLNLNCSCFVRHNCWCSSERSLSLIVPRASELKAVIFLAMIFCILIGINFIVSITFYLIPLVLSIS